MSCRTGARHRRVRRRRGGRGGHRWCPSLHRPEMSASDGREASQVDGVEEVAPLENEMLNLLARSRSWPRTFN